MKKIAIALFIALLLPFSLAASEWVNDPTNCPANDETNFPGQDCVSLDICGDNSGTAQCYDTSTISTAAGNSAGTTTNWSGDFDGGYILNCYATVDAGAPFCDNSGGMWCDRDSTCYNVHRLTQCNLGTWSGDGGDITCTTCVTGYTFCDGSGSDEDGCEVDIDTTNCPAGANNHYNSGCTCVCDSGYLDCDGGGAGTGNGCEIDDGGACSVGPLSGTYDDCSGGAGNCVVTKSYFETGTMVQYGSNSNPFLWGIHFGDAPLMDISNYYGDANFLVDNNANLYSTGDINLYSGGDINAHDANFVSTYSKKYFGDGSDLTGIVSEADTNAMYVPYIGADYDLNLDIYGLKAIGDTNLNNLGLTGGIFAYSIQGDAFVWDAEQSNFYVGPLHDIVQGSYWITALGEDHDIDCDDCFAAGYQNTISGDQGAVFGASSAVEGQFGFSAGYQCISKEQTSICLGENLTNYAPNSLMVQDINVRGTSEFADSSNFTDDINSTNIQANYFFGDGSGLDNVSATSDVNDTDVTLANLFVDNNLIVYNILEVVNDSNLEDVGISGVTFTKDKLFVEGDIYTADDFTAAEASSYIGIGAEGGVAHGIGFDSDGTGELYITHLMETFALQPDSDNARDLGTDAKGYRTYFGINAILDNNIIAGGNIKSADMNTTSITAENFFGSGYDITDIPQDINKHFIAIWDHNNNYYGIYDTNNQFLPYIGADYDLNLGTYGLKAFGDVNMDRISAAFYFGDGSGLTNLTATADINDTDVQLTNLFVDNNVIVYGNTELVGDTNTASLEADNVYSAGTITSRAITILDTIPILVFKDSTYVGDTSLGYIEWRDSTNTRLGFFGNSSSGNDDLYWRNESSGGHIILETTGAGKFKVFADINAQDNDITTTGTLKVNDLSATGDGNLVNVTIKRIFGDVNFVGTGGNLTFDEGTGRTGIGTTSPSTQFHIYNATENADIVLQTANASKAVGVTLHQPDNSWMFGVSTSGWFRVRDYDAGKNVFQILPGAEIDTLRIDSDTAVNFRIGDSLAPVWVKSANTAWNSRGNLYIYTNDSAAIDKGGQLHFGGSYTGTTETHWAAIKGAKESAAAGAYGGYLAFATRPFSAGGEQERMRITSTGQVGIGTTTPTHKLNILGDANITGNTLIESDLNVVGNASIPATFMQASDVSDQSFTATGTPYSIELDTIDENAGISRIEDGNILIRSTGIYYIAAQPQVTAAAGQSGLFHMWLQKDTGGGFADISNTNIELSLGSQEEDVILLVALTSLTEGDKIRLRASVSNTGITLDTQSPAGEPVIPSIIFSMYKIGT